MVNAMKALIGSAILFAPHHGLDHLVNIVDFNNLQSIYSTDITMNLQPFRAKWEAFGWESHRS